MKGKIIAQFNGSYQRILAESFREAEMNRRRLTIKDMSVSEDVVGRYRVRIGDRSFATM